MFCFNYLEPQSIKAKMMNMGIGRIYKYCTLFSYLTGLNTIICRGFIKIQPGDTLLRTNSPDIWQEKVSKDGPTLLDT